MSLTYAKVARVLCLEAERYRHLGLPDGDMGILSAARKLADACANDPDFDRKDFLIRCGYPDNSRAVLES